MTQRAAISWASEEEQTLRPWALRGTGEHRMVGVLPVFRVAATLRRTETGRLAGRGPQSSVSV
jgi:hypothetical protein